MVDPLIIRIIALGFSLLFFFAALHKLGNREQFSAILTAYKILPSALLKPVTMFVPFVELLLSLLWLALAILQLNIVLVPMFSMLLLLAYTSAIGINLLRGRIYIDCGCGFAKNSGNDIQQLSSGLIIRNSLLILATLVASMSPSMRELGFIDHFALLMATIAVTFIYASYNQIISNRSIINTWRNVPEKTAEGSHV